MELISTPRRILLLWGAIVFLATAATVSLSPGATQAQTMVEPTVKLRWEVVSNYIPRPGSRGRSRAAFILTNTGDHPLPVSGWALYFSSISAAAGIKEENHPLVEHVAGPLFRIRPAPSAGVIAPGASLRLDFEHSEIMVKNTKGPMAPYLVFDTAPGRGIPIDDYQSTPLPRLAQLEGAPTGFGALVSPEDTFTRNAALADIPESELPPVFPTPVRVVHGQGMTVLSNTSRITASSTLDGEAAMLARWVANLAPGAPSRPGAPIRLEIGPISGQLSPEAYRLVIAPETGVTLTGATPAGVFFGLQSLHQMLPTGPKGVADLTALTLTDAPRFAYRGLMLDVARNFQTREKLLGVLDLMARYKLNRLHLHLTDDEGWRLEIRALPELTRFGARRGHAGDGADHLPSAYGSGPDVADPHGSGFYTPSDYIEILRHAAALHIEVIPEIEMPGHARAAVKAMAARAAALRAAHAPDPDAYLLNDPDDQSQYRSAQLYSDNVINPGMASAYRFIDTVLGELADLHRQAGTPLRTIHVGADELAAGAWERSPAAGGALDRLGAATTADLWEDFYDRVAKIARDHGASLAGWEELGVRKVRSGPWDLPAPNPHFLDRGLTLHVWNNLKGSEDLAYRLANAGYEIVLSPATHLYFDMAHSRDAAEPGHNWAGYADLFDVHGFDPFRMNKDSAIPDLAPLSPAGRMRIAGIEGTLFSEMLREPARLDYMMAPRLLALAERAWAPEPSWATEADTGVADRLRHRDQSVFANQLGRRALPRLDVERPDLAYRIPPPGLVVRDGQVLANFEMPGFVLRYALGGETPDVNSPIVDGPIRDKGLVTVAAFSRNGRRGRLATIRNP